MEFRSYYSGKTIIRATSPGIKDAMIQITSRGGPRFVSGRTPAVKPRPYVRFSERGTTNSLMALGRDNPSRASGEAPGHSARLANDGNSSTFWQDNAGDANAWLQIDLERVVKIAQTKLTFPRPGNWRYKIETSDDGETNWKLLVDQTHAISEDMERMDTMLGNSISGRFVRVTIVESPDGQPAALSEIEVFGTQSAP